MSNPDTHMRPSQPSSPSPVRTPPPSSASSSAEGSSPDRLPDDDGSLNGSSSSGVRLWERAKTLIPGGNQLLSKRAEMFLPGRWPAYYKRAKGCEIWDLDDRHYYDFAQMGVGSCIIGYADPDVNRAVTRAIADGNMSSLNCAEEVELAERLIDLHPWADMARFARTGGEVCTVAIRIARAAAGKSKVAFCGYHGWHDWYLAANLADEANLDGQLLPGLEPSGTPRELRETALPFQYNDLDSLERLADVHGESIGVIMIEPVRSVDPAPGFLEGVRAIADRIGAVLIFDEITSGFRQTLGGIHLDYGVDPDVAVFGKALGNGFPISAVIGRSEVMDAAQDAFISSTFWTERSGYAAALATLDKMARCNVPDHLTRAGEKINDGWRDIAAKAGLDIRISGIPPLTHIHFEHEKARSIQTLYTDRMLDRGFLVGSAVYTTFAYTDAIIDHFLKASHDSFVEINDILNANALDEALPHGPKHAGFQRLTDAPS